MIWEFLRLKQTNHIGSKLGCVTACNFDMRATGTSVSPDAHLRRDRMPPTGPRRLTCERVPLHPTPLPQIIGQ